MLGTILKCFSREWITSWHRACVEPTEFPLSAFLVVEGYIIYHVAHAIVDNVTTGDFTTDIIDHCFGAAKKRKETYRRDPIPEDRRRRNVDICLSTLLQQFISQVKGADNVQNNVGFDSQFVHSFFTKLFESHEKQLIKVNHRNVVPT